MGVIALIQVLWLHHDCGSEWISCLERLRGGVWSSHPMSADPVRHIRQQDHTCSLPPIGLICIGRCCVHYRRVPALCHVRIRFWSLDHEAIWRVLSIMVSPRQVPQRSWILVEIEQTLRSRLALSHPLIP